MTLILLMSATISFAQYYSWGADPVRLKWMESKGSSTSVIYPRDAEQIGLTTLYFTKQMQPYINYGFTLPPLDIPFIVHPENMNSNGLVMWLPKRVEFLSSPSIDGYSMPWIKQLVAHEYRHAAQYNNLNVGFIKFQAHQMLRAISSNFFNSAGMRDLTVTSFHAGTLELLILIFMSLKL